MGEVEPTFVDTYAWVLFRLKRYEEARIYIDQALAALPETAENASVFDHAGDIYLLCGERSKALEFWKKALALTDDTQLRRQLRRKIARRRL